MNVREAVASDSVLITELWKELSTDHFEKERYIDTIPEFNGIEDCYEKTLQDENVIIFIAEEENQVCGFLELVIHNSNADFCVDRHAYMLHLYLKPKIRSFANAAAMYHAAENKTKALGIPFIMADVYKHNPGVQRLIQYFGFEDYRTRFVKKLDEATE